METILVLAHTEMDGSLGRPAREALTAARSLQARLNGSALIVGLVGADVKAAADAAAGCGADRFLGVAGAAFAQSRYATDVLAAEALCREAGATLIWRRAPRAGAGPSQCGPRVGGRQTRT
jgi:electron transfer flavoprotein alpha subunit